MTGDSVEPADEVVEGVVLADGDPGYVPPLSTGADHWPAFAPVKVVPPGSQVWHDEASRLEARGRLDRGGCECADCLGDKYSGEDYY